MDLFNNYNKEYKTYITNSKIPKYIKERITSSFYSTNNTKEGTFYLHYPALFHSNAKMEDNELTKLCIAGYLYYSSLMCLDRLYDNNIRVPDNYYIATVLQEESIKLLVELFETDSEFWEKWDQRKKEYISANQLENSNGTFKTLETYVVLADYKSSIAKIAIDALFLLNKIDNKRSYNSLLNTHKYFSVALELLDDIQDIEEDILNKQNSFAINLLNGLFTDNGKKIESETIENIKREFYTSGTANYMYELASKFLKKSLNSLPADEDLPIKNVIQYFLHKSENAPQIIKHSILKPM